MHELMWQLLQLLVCQMVVLLVVVLQLLPTLCQLRSVPQQRAAKDLKEASRLKTACAAALLCMVQHSSDQRLCHICKRTSWFGGAFAIVNHYAGKV
jgi:hypothetical protein